MVRYIKPSSYILIEGRHIRTQIKTLLLGMIWIRTLLIGFTLYRGYEGVVHNMHSVS